MAPALPRGARARGRAARGVGSRGPAWVAVIAFFALFVLPLVIFCFPGQILYRSGGRRLHGPEHAPRRHRLPRGPSTTGSRPGAGPGVVVAIAGAGIAITAGFAAIVGRVAAREPKRIPALAVITFGGALWCFWTDKVDSRYLSRPRRRTRASSTPSRTRPALPSRDRWGRAPGLHRSARRRRCLPLVSERPQKLNVLVLLTESVRADVMCSDPPPACTSEALDPVASRSHLARAAHDGRRRPTRSPPCVVALRRASPRT